MAEVMTELLRASDIAARLGVSTGRVYQMLAKGLIPHTRQGRSIRIPRAAWEAWLAAQNRLAEESIQELVERGGSATGAR